MSFEFTPPPVESLEPKAFTPPPLDSLEPMTDRDSRWLKLNAEKLSAIVERDIEEDSPMLRRALADPAIALAKGVISVPEAAVGLANIVSKGRAGKAVEDAGFKFREAKDILSSYQTGEQQMAQGRVAQAKGFIPTVQALVENPTVAAESIIESLPLMFGGGALSQAALKGIAKIGPKFATWAAGASAPVVAGAVGEGLVGAGSAAENIRQQSPDGFLTWEQAGYAAASGAGTAAFGILGGKAAQKLGLEDIQTALARGGTSAAQKAALPKFKAIVAGALQEGALEELPQSAQEQMFSNLALGKPWSKGLAEAAAQGFVAGAAMGGSAQLVSGRGQPAATPPPLPSPAPAAPVAPTPVPAPQAATPQVSQRVSVPVEPPPMPKVSGLMLNQPLSTWSTSPSSPNILAQSPDSFGIGNKVVKLSQSGGGFGKVGTVTAMTGPKVDGNPNATVTVKFDDGTTTVSGFKEFGFLENVQQAKAMSEAARGKPFEFPLPPPTPKVALPEPPAKVDSKRTVPLDAAEQLQQRINAARAAGDVATARRLAGELDMLAAPKPRRVAITPAAQAAAPKRQQELPEAPALPEPLEGQPYDTRLENRPEATMPAIPAAELGIERGRAARPVDPDLAETIEALRQGYRPQVEEAATDGMARRQEALDAGLSRRDADALGAFTDIAKMMRDSLNRTPEQVKSDWSKYLNMALEKFGGSAPQMAPTSSVFARGQFVRFEKNVDGSFKVVADEPTWTAPSEKSNPQFKKGKVIRTFKNEDALFDYLIKQAELRSASPAAAEKSEPSTGGAAAVEDIRGGYAERTAGELAAPAAAKRRAKQAKPVTATAARTSVDPKTDELLGTNDRGEPIYWSANAKTHYAISDGRIRTAPDVAGLPESAIDKLQRFYAPQEQAPVEVLRGQPPGTPAPAAEGKPGEVSQAAGEGAKEARDKSKPEQMTPEEADAFEKEYDAKKKAEALLEYRFTKDDLKKVFADLEKDPRSAVLDAKGSERIYYAISVDGKRKKTFSVTENGAPGNGFYQRSASASKLSPDNLLEWLNSRSDFWSSRGSYDPWDYEEGHPAYVRIAMEARKPVSVKAVDAYKAELPPGYIREGELYVYRPEGKSEQARGATPQEGIGSIYQMDRRGETKWLVQQGEKRGFGDSIFDTEQEAVAESQREAARREQRAESLRKMEAEKDAEAKAKAEREDLGTFTDGMSPMKRGAVVKQLTARFRYLGKEMSRRDIIRELVNQGRKVETEDGQRVLSNDKDEYLGEKVLTKAGLDYAEHLIRERDAQMSLGQTPSTDVGEQQVLDEIAKLKSVTGPLNSSERIDLNELRLSAQNKKLSRLSQAYLENLEERARGAGEQASVAQGRLKQVLGSGAVDALAEAKSLWPKEQDYSRAGLQRLKETVVIGVESALSVSRPQAIKIAEDLIEGRKTILDKMVNLEPIREREIDSIGSFPSVFTKWGYERGERKTYSHPRYSKESQSEQLSLGSTPIARPAPSLSKMQVEQAVRELFDGNTPPNFQVTHNYGKTFKAKFPLGTFDGATLSSRSSQAPASGEPVAVVLKDGSKVGTYDPNTGGLAFTESAPAAGSELFFQQARTVRGWYDADNGTIWLNAAYLRSPQEARAVFIEEAFHAIQNDKTVQTELSRLVASLTPEQISSAKAAYGNISEEQLRMEAVADILEQQQLTQEQRGILARLWDAVLGAVQRLYGKFTGKVFTERDAQDVLAKALKAAAVGRRSLKSGGEVYADGDAASVFQYSKVPTGKYSPQQLAAVANEFRALASNPKAFKYPTSNQTDIAKIAEEMAPGLVKVSREESEDGDSLIKLTTKNGSIYINDVGGDRPYLVSTDAGSAGVKGGLGTLLYQIAFTWAHNNGKTVVASPSLSEIAILRRTSNMLSSALRFGTTDHLRPDPSQRVEWVVGDTWGNIARLALKEYELVNAATGGLSDAPEFNPETLSFGRPDRMQQAVSGVDRLAPSQQEQLGKYAGIGSTTLQRSVFTESARQRGAIPDGKVGQGAVGNPQQAAYLLRLMQSDDAPQLLYGVGSPQNQLDQQYFEAIQRGDMQEVQALVDEAALSNGYQHQVFHGTQKDRAFSVFDRLAGGTSGKLFDLNSWGIWTSTDADAARQYGEQVVPLYGSMKNPARFQTFNDWFKSYVQQAYPMFAPTDGPSDFKKDLLEYMAGMRPGTKAYDAAMDEFPGAAAYRKFLVENGHDGVLIEGDFIDGSLQTVRVFLEPEQLKSAKPVTYDDQGQPIPLSQRFQQESPDIRYSLGAPVSQSDATEVQGRAIEPSVIAAAGKAVADLGSQTVEEFEQAGRELEGLAYESKQFRQARSELNRLVKDHDGLLQQRYPDRADLRTSILEGVSVENGQIVVSDALVTKLAQMGLQFRPELVRAMQAEIYFEQQARRLVDTQEKRDGLIELRDYYQRIKAPDEEVVKLSKMIAAKQKVITSISPVTTQRGGNEQSMAERASEIKQAEASKVELQSKRDALNLEPVQEFFGKGITELRDLSEKAKAAADLTRALMDSTTSISEVARLGEIYDQWAGFDATVKDALKQGTLTEEQRVSVLTSLQQSFNEFDEAKFRMDDLLNSEEKGLLKDIRESESEIADAKVNSGMADILVADALKAAKGEMGLTGTVGDAANIANLEKSTSMISTLAENLGKSLDQNRWLYDFLMAPGDMPAFGASVAASLNISEDALREVLRVVQKSPSLASAIVTIADHAASKWASSPPVQMESIAKLATSGNPLGMAIAANLTSKIVQQANSQGTAAKAVQKAAAAKLAQSVLRLRTLQQGQALFNQTANSPAFQQLRGAVATGASEAQKMVVLGPTGPVLRGFKSAAKEYQPELKINVESDALELQKTRDKVWKYLQNAEQYVEDYEATAAAHAANPANPSPSQLGFDVADYNGLKFAIENQIWPMFLNMGDMDDAARAGQYLTPVAVRKLMKAPAFIGEVFKQYEQVGKMIGGFAGNTFRQQIANYKRGYTNAKRVASQFQDLPKLQSAAMQSHNIRSEDTYRDIFNEMAHYGRLFGSPLRAGFTLPISNQTVTKADMEFFNRTLAFEEKLRREVTEIDPVTGVRYMRNGKEITRKGAYVGDKGMPRHLNRDATQFIADVTNAYTATPKGFTTGTDLSASSADEVVKYWNQHLNTLKQHILDSLRTDRSFKQTAEMAAAEKKIAARWLAGNMDQVNSVQDLVDLIAAEIPATTGRNPADVAVQGLNNELLQYVAHAERIQKERADDNAKTSGLSIALSSDNEFTKPAAYLELPSEYYDYGALTSIDRITAQSRANHSSLVDFANSLRLAIKELENRMGRLQKATTDKEREAILENYKGNPQEMEDVLQLLKSSLKDFEDSYRAGGPDIIPTKLGQKLLKATVGSVLAKVEIAFRNLSQGQIQVLTNAWALNYMSARLAAWKALSNVPRGVVNTGYLVARNVAGFADRRLGRDPQFQRTLKGAVDMVADGIFKSAQAALLKPRVGAANVRASFERVQNLGFDISDDWWESAKQAWRESGQFRTQLEENEAGKSRATWAANFIGRLANTGADAASAFVRGSVLEASDLNMNALSLGLVGNMEQRLQEVATVFGKRLTDAGITEIDPANKDSMLKASEWLPSMNQQTAANSLAEIRKFLESSASSEGFSLEKNLLQYYQDKVAGKPARMFNQRTFDAVQRSMIAENNAALPTNRASAGQASQLWRTMLTLTGYPADAMLKLLRVSTGGSRDRKVVLQAASKMTAAIGFAAMAILFQGAGDAGSELWKRKMQGKKPDRVTPLDADFWNDPVHMSRTMGRYLLMSAYFLGDFLQGAYGWVDGKSTIDPTQRAFVISTASQILRDIASGANIRFVKGGTVQEALTPLRKTISRLALGVPELENLLGMERDSTEAARKAMAENARANGIEVPTSGFRGVIGLTNIKRKALSQAVSDMEIAKRNGDTEGYNKAKAAAQKQVAELEAYYLKQRLEAGDSPEVAARTAKNSVWADYQENNPVTAALGGKRPSAEQYKQLVENSTGERGEVIRQGIKAWQDGAQALFGKPGSITKEDVAENRPSGTVREPSYGRVSLTGGVSGRMRSVGTVPPGRRRAKIRRVSLTGRRRKIGPMRSRRKKIRRVRLTA